MSKEKAIKILQKHFKALYDYAGIEWTPDDDRELEQLIDELEEIIEEKSGFPESKNILYK